MRSATCLALMALLPACFNPEDDDGKLGQDTEGETEGHTDGSTGPSSTDTTPDDTDPSTTDPTTTTTSEPTGTTTDGDAVCGDGEVNGDEVCDDGVNDGGYGSCLEDCSGPAAYCGDAELNGSETCDDGVNDGAYGGCTADCTAGPSCGDGELNGPELCDEGEDNQNGSGCNADCTTSGTLMGELLQTGFTFCDGAFTTPPQFNAEANALVSASGYCGADAQLLQELTPEVEVAQEFDVLLPSTPLRAATMVGDRWILGTSGCNYVIGPDGDYSEICQEGRVTGYYGLDGIDDERYIALGYQEVVLYGADSPALDDAPLWSQVLPEPGFYQYTWRSMVEGPNGSVIVGGSRLNTNDSTSVGYFTQFTSAGNVADTNTYAGIDDINAMAAGPDGSLLLYTASYPDAVVTKLNPAFGVDWSLPLTGPGNLQMAFDSAGDVLLLHEDGNGNGSYELRKLDPDDASERWSLPMPNLTYHTRISVAPDDYIWVASVGYGGEGGQLWVGRVSP